MRWLLCLIFGHDWSEWHEIVELNESANGWSGPFLTTNLIREGRYCRWGWGFQTRLREAAK